MYSFYRYPKIVEHAFDEAMPYVWWSRGNFGLAEKAFLRLAEKYEGKINFEIIPLKLYVPFLSDVCIACVCVCVCVWKKRL